MPASIDAAPAAAGPKPPDEPLAPAADSPVAADGAALFAPEAAGDRFAAAVPSAGGPMAEETEVEVEVGAEVDAETAEVERGAELPAGIWRALPEAPDADDARAPDAPAAATSLAPCARAMATGNSSADLPSS
ncbi:MAG: hypothetical protein ACTHKH_19100 [Trinickia sp.]